MEGTPLLVELLPRLLRDDQTVWTRLVDELSGRLLSRARACLGRRHQHEAEDVVQETWLRLRNRLPSIEQEGKICLSYVYRILVSIVRDWHGRTDKGKKLLASLDADRDEGPLRDSLESPVGEPLGDMLANERQVAVRQAITELPEIYRQAATLRLLEDLPYVEIANQCDVSLTTAKSRIQRAHKLLRQKLIAYLRDRPEPVQHAARRLRV